MAARKHRDAERLTRFCELAVIYLIILSLFTQNSLAFITYTRQDLFEIGFWDPGNFIGDLQLPAETPVNLTARPAGGDNVNTGEADAEVYGLS